MIVVGQTSRSARVLQDPLFAPLVLPKSMRHSAGLFSGACGERKPIARGWSCLRPPGRRRASAGAGVGCVAYLRHKSPPSRIPNVRTRRRWRPSLELGVEPAFFAVIDHLFENSPVAGDFELWDAEDHLSSRFQNPVCLPQVALGILMQQVRQHTNPTFALRGSRLEESLLTVGGIPQHRNIRMPQLQPFE